MKNTMKTKDCIDCMNERLIYFTDKDKQKLFKN